MRPQGQFPDFLAQEIDTPVESSAEKRATSPNLPEWTFELVDQPWSVHNSRIKTGSMTPAEIQQQLQRSADRTSDSFGRGLVAGLMLSVGVVAGAVGAWWILSRSITPDAEVEVAAVGAQPAEPASGTVVVQGDDGDGETGETTEVVVSDVDPLTGAPYPATLRGLGLDELAELDYPRAVLADDGRMVLQGRISSQAQADELVAEYESLSSDGNVVSELTITSGFPDYSVDRVFFDEVVLFGFNSVELGADDIPVLDQAVAAFEAFPTLTMTVIGFADAVGTDEVNLRFSQDRAEVIVDYWISQGVEPRRISVTAGGEQSGEDTPEVDEDEVDPARFRRVEFAADLG